MLRPGRWIGNRYRRDVLSDEDILSAIAPMGHVTSTCAIGRRDDPMAVVDPTCRVYGVDGLRVVDASIMPSVPRTMVPRAINEGATAAFLIQHHPAGLLP